MVLLIKPSDKLQFVDDSIVIQVEEIRVKRPGNSTTRYSVSAKAYRATGCCGTTPRIASCRLRSAFAGYSQAAAVLCLYQRMFAVHRQAAEAGDRSALSDPAPFQAMKSARAVRRCVTRRD